VPGAKRFNKQTGLAASRQTHTHTRLVYYPCEDSP